VAISVPEAVDVAGENADIILLEKSLTILEVGLRLGRRTLGNSIKYVKMAASSNFGNVFTVTIASAWLPFLPMLPVHIIFQNLLYDLSQLAIPWDGVDEEWLREPHAWDTKSLIMWMFFLGPTSSVFDMCTFSMFWYFFGIRTPYDNTFLFQTGWFIEGLITQTLIVHNIRTGKIPCIQSRASWQLIFGTTCAIMACLILPFIPLGLETTTVSFPSTQVVHYMDSSPSQGNLAPQEFNAPYQCSCPLPINGSNSTLTYNFSLSYPANWTTSNTTLYNCEYYSGTCNAYVTTNFASMSPPPAPYYGFLIAFLAGYILLVQAVKVIYKRIFNNQFL